VDPRVVGQFRVERRADDGSVPDANAGFSFAVPLWEA